MKKVYIKVICLLVVVMVLCCGCGEKYTCGRCGETTKEAYYDPFDTDSYFCEDCAREYFAPFPYSSYKVD